MSLFASSFSDELSNSMSCAVITGNLLSTVTSSANSKAGFEYFPNPALELAELVTVDNKLPVMTAQDIELLNSSEKEEANNDMIQFLLNETSRLSQVEEKILKGQKDNYVKSMEELFEDIKIVLDPHDLSVQGLARAFDPLMEKFARFQAQIALAESEPATWKLPTDASVTNNVRRCITTNCHGGGTIGR